MTTAETLVEAFKLAGQAREADSNKETPSYDALEAACRKNKESLLESAAYDCLRYVATQYNIASLTALDAKTKDQSKFYEVWMAAIFLAHIEYDN